MASEWFFDETQRAGMSDDEAPEYDPYEQDYETWCDYYSEELATLYHSLKDHAAAMGLPMLEHMDMPAFCEFAFRVSSGRKPEL